MPLNTQMIDEADLALVEALQVSPRAAWKEISRSLDTDARAASRRWQRLQTQGLAWIACTPGPASASVFVDVQIACAPSSVDSVAAALSHCPQFVTVHSQAGGGHALAALAVAPSIDAVADTVLGELVLLPEITAYRFSVVTRIFRQGSDWRVGALDDEMSSTLSLISRSGKGARRLGPAAQRLRDPLLSLLNEDGRMSTRRLSERMGEPEATTRRALSDLLGAGHLLQRCEVSHTAVGRPVNLILWLRVPPEHLASVAKALSQLTATRVCVALAGGESNLVAQFWLHTAAEVPSVERFVAMQSDTSIVERNIVLRHYKRFNHHFSEGQHAPYAPAGTATKMR